MSFSQLPSVKKYTIFGAAQTKFGPSYFVRALVHKGFSKADYFWIKNHVSLWIFFFGWLKLQNLLLLMITNPQSHQKTH